MQINTNAYGAYLFNNYSTKTESITPKINEEAENKVNNEVQQSPTSENAEDSYVVEYKSLGFKKVKEDGEFVLRDLETNEKLLMTTEREKAMFNIEIMKRNAAFVTAVREAAAKNAGSLEGLNLQGINVNYHNKLLNASDEVRDEMLANMIETLQDPYAIGYRPSIMHPTREEFLADKQRTIEFIRDLIKRDDDGVKVAL